MGRFDDPVGSPQLYARLGGLCYLVIIVTGLFGEAFVRGRLVVRGDPAATAERILASESLWRAGIAGELLMLVCGVGLLLALYVLLRPVSRELALLAVFFNLVSISIEAGNKLNLMQALFPLSGADYLGAVDPAHLQVLGYLATRAHAYGFGIGLIFFGCVCLVVGHLIFYSGYLPRAIGVLMGLAGACYLANSFAMILSPELAGRMFPFILLVPLVAELSLCLWLLFRGVDRHGWARRAGEARTSGGPA